MFEGVVTPHPALQKETIPKPPTQFLSPKIELEHYCLSKKLGDSLVNNDFYGVYSGEFGKLYIISRGIGLEGVDTLAHLAVMAIKDYFKNIQTDVYSTLGSVGLNSETEESDSLEAVNIINSIRNIKQAVLKATSEVLSYISRHDWLSNSGLSLALLLSNSEGVYLAHSGDCRILLIRDKTITNLTEDVFKYQDFGIEIGLTHIEPEIQSNLQFFKNDILLMVTKGVYQRVTNPEMLQIFSGKELISSVKALWDYAKEKKSIEDFTIISLKVLKAPKMLKNRRYIQKEKVLFVFSLLLFSMMMVLFIISTYPFIVDLLAKMNS